MKNDYECPRCHNIFPKSNIVMHNVRCTDENPMPLDQSRQIQLNPQKNNRVDNTAKSNEKEKENNPRIKEIYLKERPKIEEIPPKHDQQPNQGLNREEYKNLSQSGEFPEIFVCEKCHETLPLSEKKDHMLCHNLQSMEANTVNNNEDNLQFSQRAIEQQKLIEKQIERENQMRRQMENQRQQNQRREENNMRNQNNLMDSDTNMLSESDMQFFGNMPGFNVPQNTHTQNARVIISRTGPDGRTIVQQFNRGGSDDIDSLMGNMMNPMMPMMNPRSIFNDSGNRRRQFIPFNMFSNNRNDNFHSIFEQILQRMRSHEHPTDQHILNELPETEIDDVTKLDPEKKNCVICLEDFKNGDKATVLPCIHLFHSNCIQNWLKTQNCCPICKFKLTGENLNSQP